MVIRVGFLITILITTCSQEQTMGKNLSELYGMCTMGHVEASRSHVVTLFLYGHRNVQDMLSEKK